MNKNITDEFQRHINETIKKVPEKETPKALPEEKQALFTKLCKAQNTKWYPTVLYYVLNALRK